MEMNLMTRIELGNHSAKKPTAGRLFQLDNMKIYPMSQLNQSEQVHLFLASLGRPL